MGYKETSTNFATYFYNLAGTNLLGLKVIFKPNVLVTYNGQESIGFDSYAEKYKFQGIISPFKYEITDMCSQPIGQNILLQIIGKKHYAYSSSMFVETFLLEFLNGAYFVSNVILKQ